MARACSFYDLISAVSGIRAKFEQSRERRYGRQRPRDQILTGAAGQGRQSAQDPVVHALGDGTAAAAPGSDGAVARQGARPREGEVRRAKNPSVDELEHFNKPELKTFLRDRGLGQTGTKEQLLKVAKPYATRPVIPVNRITNDVCQL